MVDIQTVSIAIASAGVLIAAIYYVLQIRHQTRIRKTDLVIRLYSTFSSNEFQEARRTILSSKFKDYEDFIQKYGSVFSETPMNKAVGRVAQFYDLVGVLLYRKHIDLSLVYDVVGTRVIKMVYEKLRPFMVGVRREFDEPGAYVGFEYLYDELMRKEPDLRKTWGKYLSQPVSDIKSSNQSSR
jgi:hypothetical protein